MLEVVIAAGLSVLAFGGVSALLIGGLSGWINDESKLNAQDLSEQGLRMITSELRNAISVTVDANGQGITYELPATDAHGNYLSPVVWDGVNRRIALQGTNLVKIAGNSSWIIVTGVTLADPLLPSNSNNYQIFTPGAGAVTRMVTVELVTMKSGANSGTTTTARNRETISLRNAPQIVRS